jgi:hypothetical protein
MTMVVMMESDGEGREERKRGQGEEVYFDSCQLDSPHMYK